MDLGQLTTNYTNFNEKYLELERKSSKLLKKKALQVK
jgi:hypothetical protein